MADPKPNATHNTKVDFLITTHPSRDGDDRKYISVYNCTPTRWNFKFRERVIK